MVQNQGEIIFSFFATQCILCRLFDFTSFICKRKGVKHILHFIFDLSKSNLYYATGKGKICLLAGSMFMNLLKMTGLP